jgi:hypothetical protein
MKKLIMKASAFIALGVLLNYNIQLSTKENSANLSLSYLKNLAFAQSEGGTGGGGEGGTAFQNSQSTTQTKTVVESWNASLKIWEIGGGGSTTRTVVTGPYQCCMGGNSTCNGISC